MACLDLMRRRLEECSGCDLAAEGPAGESPTDRAVQRYVVCGHVYVVRVFHYSFTCCTHEAVHFLDV